MLYYKRDEEREDVLRNVVGLVYFFSLNKEEGILSFVFLLINIVETTVVLPNFLVRKFLLADGYHGFLGSSLENLPELSVCGSFLHREIR